MRWQRIALIGSLWILTGCASGFAAPKPPVTIPPKVEETKSLEDWLTAVVAAGRDNCVTLKVLRHETDTEKCDPTR